MQDQDDIVITLLGEELIFPPVEQACPDGLLAIDGDLSPERLLLAYRSGIFPWYSDGLPILWFSPDPRMVLFPEDLHVPRSLSRVIASGRFRVTWDGDFAAVIQHCQRIYRPSEEGTWITEDMREAYIRLHAAGHAHSVEVWYDDVLAGGLYGVTTGLCFSGESMFTMVPDAAKVGFVWLVERLRAQGFRLIDCQVHTEHLARFGAREIPRSDFLALLRDGGPARIYP